MSKDIFNPPDMMKPAGYSHVAKVTGGSLVYIAGQVPVDASGNLVGEGYLEAQAEQVFKNLKTAVEAAGVPKERLVIDAVIARGLDYYTGIIYETFLDALPDLGSICSGGRYDNLAALYTNQQLPGIGASLDFRGIEIDLGPLQASTNDVQRNPQLADPASVDAIAETVAAEDDAK